MGEKPLTSEQIKEQYLSDVREELDRIEEDLKRTNTDIITCSEREDLDKCEIIWEFVNSVLFVLPEGDELYASFIQFLRYCSDLVWTTPTVRIYDGKLAINVILVDAYIPGGTVRN